MFPAATDVTHRKLVLYGTSYSLHPGACDAALPLKCVRRPFCAPDSMESLSGTQANVSSGPALAAATSRMSSLPVGWEMFTNLHGAVYYAYDDCRLLTTNDMHDPEMVASVLDVYDEWSAVLDDINAMSTQVDDAEMFVFHAGEEALLRFASWSRGRTYDVQEEGDAYIAPGQPERFWDYVWQLTAHRTYFPKFMEKQFVSALAFGANECTLDVKHTTIPFDADQIKRLMRVYRQLRGKGRDTPEHIVPALSYHVCRAMFNIEAARATASVRLTRAPRPPTLTGWPAAICDIALGILLCGTHTVYRTRLELAVPNGAFSVSEFRRLMEDVVMEWADSNLVATLLVSVNVGFLSLQDLTHLQRTSALASTLLAAASLATGLHHVWQHRARHDADSDDIHRYLFYPSLWRREASTSHPEVPTARDLIPTACLLALPRAGLRWAVLAFALATGRSLLILLVPGAFVLFWAIWSDSSTWRERLRAGSSWKGRNWNQNGRLREILRMDSMGRAGDTV
ncbi:hypothetical protein FB451DRAFT_1292159 [Mycena latifolia]|nr:hypothetical protein FB451DRAFT_1292159 [Mycena latifolia]